MASLDVDFLFTNIPLDERINICVDNQHNGCENPSNIPRHDLRNLFKIITNVSFFTFNNNIKKKMV